MPATFRTTRLVEFGDTDMAGIVHFTRFFHFMESAEQALLRSLGLSVVTEWEGVRVSFPRVSASCDYLRPVRFEDVLTVDVAVRNVGRASVTYGFEFSKDDEPVARGQITAVCATLNSATGRMAATAIPENIRAQITAAPEELTRSVPRA